VTRYVCVSQSVSYRATVTLYGSAMLFNGVCLSCSTAYAAQLFPAYNGSKIYDSEAVSVTSVTCGVAVLWPLPSLIAPVKKIFDYQEGRLTSSPEKSRKTTRTVPPLLLSGDIYSAYIFDITISTYTQLDKNCRTRDGTSESLKFLKLKCR
jgi:hypothetical protein